MSEANHAEVATAPRPPQRPVRAGALVAAAVLCGTLGSGVLVWQGTAAVFSASTVNGSNSWTAGSVALSDDDAGSALFAASGLVPGASGANCLAVTYSGDVATSVRLYASASADVSSVAQYLDVVIEVGAGGGFGSCGAFVASSTIYSGTLSDFTTVKDSWANGVPGWSPSGPGSRVYKVSYTLNAATPSAKQGATTTATFTWEAQA